VKDHVVAAPVSASDAALLGCSVAEQVERVIVGKADQTRLLTIALLADGHVLLDDVPGVAKTLLVRTLAAALGLSFFRIQCTPDLLPGDVTGSLVFDQKTGEFVFRRGPLFANIVLADEINRATPRTQSAFLEAMEERGVTVDGVTHGLPRPFLVLATQNPIELKGTFPLPEAQVDRFLLSLRMGYPSAEDELLILARFRADDPLAEVLPILVPERLDAARLAVRGVHVSDDLARYIVALTQATRTSPLVRLGASPRASLALQRAAQASAALDGRDFVIPDDVQSLATPVLAHRLVLARSAVIEGRDAAGILSEVVGSVPVPVESGEDDPASF
jgi:MoxR-like ATPase